MRILLNQYNSIRADSINRFDAEWQVVQGILAIGIGISVFIWIVILARGDAIFGGAQFVTYPVIASLLLQ